MLLTLSPWPGTDYDAAAQLSLPSVNRLPDIGADETLRRMEERTARRKAAEAAAAEELPSTTAVPDNNDLAEASLPGDVDGQEGTMSSAFGVVGAQSAQDVTTEIAGAAGSIAQEVGNNATTVAGQVPGTVQQTVAATLRAFVAEPGPGDWPIERNVRLLMLDDEQLAAFRDTGIEIISTRSMPSIARTLTVARDEDQARLDGAINELRNRFPDVVVDFNHVYRYSNSEVTVTEKESVEGGVDFVPGKGAVRKLRIGMIDSAVTQDHVSIRNREIERQDFVSNEGSRPLGHGSAVASLIARHSPADAQIVTASVFFEAPGFAPGATTESLVAALDWLTSKNVDVINMSLSGPANDLLELAIAQLVKEGPVVVAAVGNNGPSGERLYPAAYEGVIGATAIDRQRKIFRYANRGEHVDFAALGVNVKVADAGGGWRMESGTSMASPQIAVIIGQAVASGLVSRKALMSVLMADAEDLGRRGFDKKFGHGLIRMPSLLFIQDRLQTASKDD